VIDICRSEELPPGEHKLVEWDDLEIGVFNCNGAFFAIEDRCSHDNGDLVQGTLDQERCVVECPRHCSLFDQIDRRGGAVSFSRPIARPIDLLNGWRRTRDGVCRPACAACGRRVVDSGHATHLHGGVYHPDCALYGASWGRDRGRLA